MRLLFVYFSIFFFLSCGTRKRVLQKEIDKGITIESNNIASVQANYKIVADSSSLSSLTITVMPIDSTAEFVVRGNTYKNAKIELKKKKKEIKQEAKHYDYTTSTDKTITQHIADKRVKLSNTDRKAPIFGYLIGIAIIAGGLILYKKFV